MKRSGLWKVAACVAAISAYGCTSGDDDDATPMAGTGVAGMTGGGAGAAGTTMMVAGMGGAGMGGAGAGAAGMAGSTAAGSGGMAGSMPMVSYEPKFSVIFQDIFVRTGCAGGTYCHQGTANLTGGLSMNDKDETHALLVGVDASSMTLMPTQGPSCKDSGMKRVVAGDPENSLLMKKIDTTMPPCGQPMPPTGMLDAMQIEQIRTWIMNGAMND